MALKLNWKIWILIISIVLSILFIFNLQNLFQEGVLITSVDPNSAAFEQGLREGQIITNIDGKEIKHLQDFSIAMSGKFETNTSVKTTILTTEQEIILFSRTSPEISVSEVPKTAIKLGLDLVGGSRALVQAQDRQLSSSEVNDLADVVNNRLNVYGIADLNVRPVSDLSGNNFLLVEIAGATPKDLQDLISQQGKFEAKIANDTVFIGGERDITSVCRGDATCAMVESCQPTDSSGTGFFCNFRFSVYLSEEAAKRHAEITQNLEINSTSGGDYLSQPLDLYLDDNLVDSLLISEGLRGRVTTQISISGSGIGVTEEEAYDDAEASMKNLQTILITGSLPFKLEIVKLDTISPVLGSGFTKTILLAGLVAILAVTIVIFFRYKKVKYSLALLFTSLSEVLIILGIASLIEWNLDLPSIAGILATIGTGIDQQIIVLDEARQGTYLSIKQKLKRAFAIILGAYFTVVVALLPLLWAGAGLLKGFAVTTLIGVTVGVLITRPAFTEIIRKIHE